MTPDLDALTALLAAARAFSEEASPGPWWRETGVATSEEEHMVWLTNEGQDTLMVNADDAAMLVNALPSLIEAARREAGLREWVQQHGEHSPFCDYTRGGSDCSCGLAALLHDNAGVAARAALPAEGTE